ncbi:prepilin-type N-terminal cleavage/methylation domain-containing protein [Paenibacillus mesophilus]|uniref:prepilin-type N-terminal cleavage/methylation domain-containing protein n=1 Tax=Paenibacillus mesophilus TaxID=2582849 RepID=UPI00110D9D29|nr:prepilin-type N-terminal cleavage/methylation domain-containing protein [Paenibacillus mesophilus]TMV52641.1 prepilin-type N-terminal cleavage/methylation domain-containing protein [Paenibacillus mesophilus]
MKKWKLLKNQKGLTLVELLAVIVILGIIAAIAIPSIGGIVENSKRNADAETDTLVREAAILYLTTVDPDGNGLLAGGGAVAGYTAGTPDTVTATTLQAQGYLRNIPRRQSNTTGTDNYNAIPVQYGNGGWTSPAATAITFN